MKIGVIGPSKFNDLEHVNPSAKQIVTDIVDIVLGHEIFLTPDIGSVSEFFAQTYLEKGGERLSSVLPMEDKEFGVNHVNSTLGEKINCGTWRNQPEKLNEETQALICLGYSTGGLIEIAYSKWFNKKPVFIIKELISGKLPEEAVKSLDLRYISYKDLEKILV